jgi:hypothetical protein
MAAQLKKMQEGLRAGKIRIQKHQQELDALEIRIRKHQAKIAATTTKRISN